MSLDRISVRNRRDLVDAAGRQVVLRGLVTLTSLNFGGPVELSEADYVRMAEWGFNAQVIRLEAGRLGVLGTAVDSTYLDKLDRWTTWAAQHGIYTMFKMTTYDIPSQVPAKTPFDPGVWDRLWNEAAMREDRIEGWRQVWRRFVGRSEVVGYDIINEPGPGSDDVGFAQKYLFPFYEDVSIALREIDSEALLGVQPDIGTAWWRDINGLPRHEPGDTPHGQQAWLSDDQSLYAPHFYPDMIKALNLQEYDAEMDGLVAEGQQVGAPVLVAEFGSPDAELLRQMLVTAGKEEAADLRAGYQSWNDRAELEKAVLLDKYGLGFIRPWYIDVGPWAIMGPGFTETRKLELVVRPFPQRIQGCAPTWNFDYDTYRLVATLVIDPGIQAPTLVAVQVDRFYPKGFRVSVDGADVDLPFADGVLQIPVGALASGEHRLVIERA